ncbi:hypothetical protein AnaeK_4180 [Anaeromyxobacter sp. K]|uniref:hypothetical protein n=1 Tax=Anaeromyxobacter sp. (strain K) TaxID=447217 RepID=UPI00015F934E|nr:hypothetical protein [Anaeromyxobacter sp. K]ACG75383.1 hypothetical protein AnaeK_4180 [Anaeromyxobacter sp. K]
MPLARFTTALWAALLPLAALAQPVRDAAPAPRSGYGWLWMLVAALVLVALFRMFFSRPRRTPGARGPGP